MVIVLCSRKGGTGKTTIACSLAVSLQRQRKKRKVCIVATDPQGSCERWAEIRSKNLVGNDKYDDILDMPVIRMYEYVHKKIPKLKSKYDYVIVDTSGQDSVELRSALLVADSALYVVRPNEVDISTCEYMLNVFAESKKRNEKLKIKSVISNFSSLYHQNDIKKSKDDLKNINMNPIWGNVKERRCYVHAMERGFGVEEMSKAKAGLAKREINHIAKELTDG